MKLKINLWSRKDGELKRFLESYYEQPVDVMEESGEWTCTYGKPLEAIDMISAVIDNNDKYHLTLCIQMDEGQMHLINSDNHNAVIKDIYNLFYNENAISLN